MVKQLITALILLASPCVAGNYILATGQDGTKIVYTGDRLLYSDWTSYLKMWQPFCSDKTAGTYYDYGPLGKDGSQATSGDRPTFSSTFGGCYDFDGAASGDNMLIGNVLTLGFDLQDFTAMTWVKIDVASASCVAFTTRRWELGIGVIAGGTATTSAGELAAYHFDSAVRTLDSNMVAATNTWYHLALVTKDNTGHYFYVNGSLVASNSLTADVVYVSDNCRIGARHDDTGWYWNGMLDDVRLYSRSMTAAQVLAIYNETDAQH